MREYVITLIAVSIICGIVQTLAPEGNGDGLRKYVKLASTLCLLCIIIAPVSVFIRELNDNGIALGEGWLEVEELDGRYEEVYKESIEGYTAAELEEICETEVSRRFEISGDIFDISVVIISENEMLKVERATLFLHKTTDKNDPRDIAEYISYMLECECEIIYQ